MTVAVLILSVTLIATCFRYRQILQKQNTADIGNIQNAVYEGDIQLHRKLPHTPHTDGDYEQPAEYAQLDSSKRVPMDANYQSLINEVQLQPTSNRLQ